VSVAGSPLFCDVALAARIERAEAELMALAAEAAGRRNGSAGAFAMPLAGGMATYAEDGSPFDKVAGLGFGGVPEEAALAEVEHAFAARGAPVQVELSTLGDPAIGGLLTERGYRLEGFEDVLGRAIDGALEPVAADGVEIRPSGDDELELWLDVVTDAFLHADEEGVPSHESFAAEGIKDADRDFEAAGVRRYSALRDGELAGGASFRVAGGGIAQLTGAATVPAHRRRGIQSALLAARLADAAAAGCDIAVVTTQPGSKSQQNVQRRGFHLLYTRAILVRRD
jgi:GNAT superfamily N-acetyltransferase